MKSLLKVGMLSLGVCLLFGISLALPTTVLAETHTVIVRNFAFSPQNITIQKGDIIRFEWESGVHTVTNGTGPTDPNVGNLFDTASDSGNPLFEYTFNDAGNFAYFCRPHFAAGMTGTVVVEDGVAVDPKTWSTIKRIFRNTAPVGNTK